MVLYEIAEIERISHFADAKSDYLLLASQRDQRMCLRLA